jgi:hypothetical protein
MFFSFGSQGFQGGRRFNGDMHYASNIFVLKSHQETVLNIIDKYVL